MTPGIRIIDEAEGAGAHAQKGDAVCFDCAATLNKGAVVHLRRTEQVVLGTRQVIPGIEASLIGMREGGYRKVRISPHLAYGAAGIDGKVPANAVLIYELWLTSIQQRG
jgi:FKBP-type peptidyl-prolyl cis-trans isomerase